MKAAEPGRFIRVDRADVWFLQFWGDFNGCVVIAVASASDSHTEKKIREAVLEVKRRVRWEVCVRDPETSGGRFMKILASLYSSIVLACVMVLEK